MNELTAFQAQAANLTLHNILNGTTLYISDVTGLANLLGTQIGGKDYEAIRGLHCFKWADIPEPLRTQVKEKIIELLGLPPPVIDIKSYPPQEEPQEPEKKLRLAFWK